MFQEVKRRFPQETREHLKKGLVDIALLSTEEIIEFQSNMGKHTVPAIFIDEEYYLLPRFMDSEDMYEFIMSKLKENHRELLI